MATNTTMTIRMDADLKKQAEKICDDIGLTMSAAITIFIKRMVTDRAIPFTLSAGKSSAPLQHDIAADADMEAFNRFSGSIHRSINAKAELLESREERHARKWKI